MKRLCLNSSTLKNTWLAFVCVKVTWLTCILLAAISAKGGKHSSILKNNMGSRILFAGANGLMNPRPEISRWGFLGVVDYRASKPIASQTNGCRSHMFSRWVPQVLNIRQYIKAACSGKQVTNDKRCREAVEEQKYMAGRPLAPFGCQLFCNSFSW